MKKSILLMLPFALGLAACSGGSPLDKGNIITPKFMERNFVDTTTPVELSRDYSVDEKYEIGNYTLVQPLVNNYDLWAIEDSEGKIGVFSLAAKKVIVAPGEYVLSDTLFTDYYSLDGQRIYFVIYGAYDTENETASWHVVDELGNEVFAMDTHDFDYPYIDEARYLSEFEKQNENEYFVVLCGSYAEYEEEQFAVYNVDSTLSRTGKLSEFADNANYAFGYHETMEAYGHPELAMVKSATGNGERYSFYNLEEKKFTASFTFDEDQAMFFAGDFVVVQQLHALEERATDYDLYAGGIKYNVETTKYNYTNGSKEDIDTKLYFVGFDGTYSMEVVDEKGVVKYHYFQDVQVIRDDKTLENQAFGFILDESLNVSADVTGILFSQLVKLGDYYFDWANRMVYDGKLNEVAYFPEIEEISEYGVVFEEPDEFYYGFASLDGKTIAPAKFDLLREIYNGVYMFQDKAGYGTIKAENGELKEVARFSIEELTPSGMYDPFGGCFALQDEEGEYTIWNTYTGEAFEPFELPEGETALTPLSGSATQPTSVLLGSQRLFDIAIQRADGSIYALRTSMIYHYGFQTIAE